MANYNILPSGNRRIPLGGTAVANIAVERSGADEDVSTVQAVWKDDGGSTLSDETWSGSDISTTAADGGAITLTDPVGTGNYRATYTIPNDGTYTPPTAGLTFTLTLTATDSDGATDGGTTFEFIVIDATLTVSVNRSTVTSTVKRRAGLTKEILHAVKSADDEPAIGGNDAIDLGEGIIYDIIAAYKNGTAMTITTDYLWNTFDTNVRLTTDVVDNDHFVFEVQRHMSDTAIEDYVEQAEHFILNRLRTAYDDTALAAYGEVESLITAHATAHVTQYALSKGVALENPQYRNADTLLRETRDITMAVSRGEIDLHDDDGVAITRRAGAILGRTRHTRGAYKSRIDLVDLAQQWQGIYEAFHPENQLRVTTTTPRS